MSDIAMVSCGFILGMLVCWFITQPFIRAMDEQYQHAKSAGERYWKWRCDAWETANRYIEATKLLAEHAPDHVNEKVLAILRGEQEASQ